MSLQAKSGKFSNGNTNTDTSAEVWTAWLQTVILLPAVGCLLILSLMHKAICQKWLYLHYSNNKISQSQGPSKEPYELDVLTVNKIEMMVFWGLVKKENLFDDLNVASVIKTEHSLEKK